MSGVLFLGLFLISGPKVIYAIQNGEDASVHNYPFVGSLQKSSVHICNTVLIRMRVAITADHCFLEEGENVYISLDDVELFVAMGEDDQKFFGKKEGQTKKVKYILHHPKFKVTSRDPQAMYDIGAVLLASSVRRTRYVQPIFFPTDKGGYEKIFIKSGQPCSIVGWGSANVSSIKGENVSYPSQLRSSEVIIIDKNKCCSRYLHYQVQECMDNVGYYQSGIGCFTHVNLEEGIGHRDEGAPIVCSTPQHPTILIGIVVGGKISFNRNNPEEEIMAPGFRILENTMNEFLRTTVAHPEGLAGRTAIVDNTEFSYLGSLSYDKGRSGMRDIPMTHMCNVVFVHGNAAITTARCLYDDICIKPLRPTRPEMLKVYGIGDYRPSVGVKTTAVSPKANFTRARPFYNAFDIGVVILKEYWKTPSEVLHIVPADMKKIAYNMVAWECEIVSFAPPISAYIGSITDSLRDATTPTRVQVNVTNAEVCCSFFPSSRAQCLKYYKTSGNRCHVFPRGRESFLGDSGSPVICYYKSRLSLFGLQSAVFPEPHCAISNLSCATTHTPAAHVNLSIIRDFINDVVVKMVQGFQPREIASKTCITIVIIAQLHIQ